MSGSGIEAEHLDIKSKKSKKLKDKESTTNPSEDVEVTKKSKKRKREEANAEEEDEESRRKREKKERKRLKKLEKANAEEIKHDIDVTDPVEVDQHEKKKKSKKSKKDGEPESSTVTEPSTSSSTAVATPFASPSPELPTTTTPTPSEISAYLSKHSITITGDAVPVLSFDQLTLHPKLRAALNGFKEPTPIQACAWPALINGKDVIGIAETGSGKTLAFGLPALSRLVDHNTDSNKKKGPDVSVLVVAPTRELAIQTHDTLLALGEPFGILSVCLFGGMDKGAQKKSLQGSKGEIVRIVVGTPGRILDLLNEGALDLSKVTYLVLDEADRMLDKGFENDIRAIIGTTAESSKRQTLMFSATWPDSVRRLASTFLTNPVRITVGSDDLTANSKVEQVVEVFDDPRSKDSRLSALLQSLEHQKNSKPGLDESRILVFVLYKKEAARVEGTLRRMGYSVGGIHGDLGQAQRLKALEEFKTGKTGLLVATDVAARGLDIPNVGAVVNYSFPLTIEDYIHRIGRTGRGGRSGKSITFFTGENHERALAGELMRVLKDSGFTCEGLKKFPMTVKKKEHSAYGAWFKEMGPGEPVAATKIKFD